MHEETRSPRDPSPTLSASDCSLFDVGFMIDAVPPAVIPRPRCRPLTDPPRLYRRRPTRQQPHPVAEAKGDDAPPPVTAGRLPGFPVLRGRPARRPRRPSRRRQSSRSGLHRCFGRSSASRADHRDNLPSPGRTDTTTAFYSALTAARGWSTISRGRRSSTGGAARSVLPRRRRGRGRVCGDRGRIRRR